MRMINVLVDKNHAGVLDTDFEIELKDLYEWLHCETIDIITRYILGKPYQFIVDDEGLLKENNFFSAVCRDFPEIIRGAILITRYDDDGEMVGLTPGQADMILSQVKQNKLFYHSRRVDQ